MSCYSQPNIFLQETSEDSLILQIIDGECSNINYWIEKGVSLENIKYDCEIAKYTKRSINLLDILVFKNDTTCIRAIFPFIKSKNNSYYLIGKIGSENVLDFFAKLGAPNLENVNSIYWGLLDRQKYNCLNRCIYYFQQSTINDLFTNSVGYLMETDSVFRTDLEKDTSDEGVKKVLARYNINIPDEKVTTPNCVLVTDTLNMKLLGMVFNRFKIVPDDAILEFAATRSEANFPFLDYFVIDQGIAPKTINTKIEIAHNFIERNNQNLYDILKKLFNDSTGIHSYYVEFNNKILMPLINKKRLDIVVNIFQKLKLPYEILSHSDLSIHNLLGKIDFVNMKQNDIDALNFIQFLIENNIKGKSENYIITDLTTLISQTSDIATKNKLSSFVLMLLKEGYVLNKYEVRDILLSAKEADISYVVLPIVRYANDSDIVSITKYLSPQEKNKIIQYFFLKGECSISSNISVLKDALDDNNEQLILLLSAQKKEGISSWSNYDVIKLLNIISGSSASVSEKKDFLSYYLKSVSSKEELSKLLILSVQTGNYELVNTILNAGADINFQNASCLYNAFQTKNKDIIELLCNRNPVIENINDYKQFIGDKNVGIYLIRLVLKNRLLNCDLKYTPELFIQEYSNQLTAFNNIVGFKGHLTSKQRSPNDGTYYTIVSNPYSERDFNPGDCNYNFMSQKPNLSYFTNYQMPLFCNSRSNENNKTILSFECAKSPYISTYFEYSVLGEIMLPKIPLLDLNKSLVSPFVKIEVYYSGYDLFFPKNDKNTTTITITQGGVVIPYTVSGVIIDRTIGDISIQVNGLTGTNPEIRVTITNDYYDFKGMNQFEVREELKERDNEDDRFAFYTKIYALKKLYAQDISNHYFKPYNSFLNLLSQKAIIKKYDVAAENSLRKAAEAFLELDDNSLKLVAFFAKFNQGVDYRLKKLKLMVDEAIQQTSDNKMKEDLQSIRNELDKANENLGSSKTIIDAFSNRYFTLLQRKYIEYQVYLLELSQYKTIDEIKNLTKYTQNEKEKLKIVFDNENANLNNPDDFKTIIQQILK